MSLVRLDPQYRLVFGAGGELHATSELARMEQEIARLAPQDALSLRRFFADNRTKLERFQPCMEAPFSGWRDVCTAPMLRLLPLLRPWRSLDRELRTYFQDPRVRLAFAFQAKYLGMSPFQCPSLFSILSFLEYAYGVYHPLGGCGAVTASMARVATRLGVDIRLNEPVTKKRREAPSFTAGRDRRWARRARCPSGQSDPGGSRALNGRGEHGSGGPVLQGGEDVHFLLRVCQTYRLLLFSIARTKGRLCQRSEGIP